MKKMTLIEMDGFLKGKCIPSDLKVNETNAEYLVRKFGELESKLETALRECRSAGITIDNLEAKCAALAADNKKAMEAMRQADAAVKLAHEKFSALAAENEVVNFYLRNGPVIRKGGELVAAHQFAPETQATDAFLAELRTHDLNAFIRHHSAELDAHIKNGGDQFDEKSVRIRDIIVSARLFREQIRKEAAQ